jgi:hypothetical protein
MELDEAIHHDCDEVAVGQDCRNGCSRSGQLQSIFKLKKAAEAAFYFPAGPD